MRTFKKLLLKNNPAIFAAALFLFSCGKAPEHAKYIPGNAAVVTVMDLKSMGNKNPDFAKFFKLYFFTNAENLSEKIKNLGIDFSDPAYIFGEIEGYAAATLALSDVAKFETFVKELDKNVTVNSSGKIMTAALQSKQQVLIGWNDKTVIFLYMEAGEDKIKEKLSALFNPKPGESLADQDQNFKSFLNETADLTFWLNLEKAGKFASMANQMAANINLKETYLQAQLNFEKGEVVTDTKYFTNKETGETFGGMTRDNISDEVIDALPGKNVIALLGFAIDLNKLYDYLEKENLVEGFNRSIQESTGMQGKEALQIFSGDVAASFNGLKSLAEPEFAIGLGINDNEKINRLLSSFAEKGTLQKKDDYYSSQGFFIAVKDKKLILGPESMSRQLIDGSGEKLNSDLKGLLSSNASVIYFSVSDIPDFVFDFAGEKIKSNIKNSSLQSITVTGKNMKDYVSKGKIVVSFKNKEENSLVTLVKISEDLKEEPSAEIENQEIPDAPDGMVEKDLKKKDVDD